MIKLDDVKDFEKLVKRSIRAIEKKDNVRNAAIKEVINDFEFVKNEMRKNLNIDEIEKKFIHIDLLERENYIRVGNKISIFPVWSPVNDEKGKRLGKLKLESKGDKTFELPEEDMRKLEIELNLKLGYITEKEAKAMNKYRTDLSDLEKSTHKAITKLNGGASDDTYMELYYLLCDMAQSAERAVKILSENNFK